MQFVPPPSLAETNDDGEEWESVASPATAAAREAFYSSLLSKPELNMVEIRRYARRGVPDSLRPIFWKILLNYLPVHPKDWDQVLSDKRANYRQFVEECNKLKLDGNIESDKRNDTIHRIDVDIPRTMPSLHFFACEETRTEEGIPVVFSPNQESLRRILHTMAKLNVGLGYVQGMNELVGHLLFCFSQERVGLEPQDVEADVFFCFQGMLTHISDNFCRVLDFDQSQGVSNTIETYRRLLEYCDPELSDYLNETGVKAEFYAFRWVTLLLSQEFLVPDVLRLWDYIFSFCEDINAAVYFTAVSMCIAIREDLMGMSFTQIMPTLQQYPPTDIGDIIKLSQTLMNTYGVEAITTVMDPSYKTREQLAAEEEAAGNTSVAETLNRGVDEARTKLKGLFSGLGRKKGSGSPAQEDAQ